MRRSRRKPARLRFETLEGRLVLDAGPVLISEFMAVNDTTLRDSDGDYSDWIEIHNAGDEAVDLEGWHLTDNDGDLQKWRFPAVSLPADDYLVVFASNKNRKDPAAELHTNFKLGAGGEYLALVQPAGGAISHQYAPEYPQQYADVSFGMTAEISSFTVAGAGQIGYLVPTLAEGPLGTGWTEPGYSDASWNHYGESATILITEARTHAPEYVEIQNVTEVTVNTAGWQVAVNDAQAFDVNAVNPTRWQLPGSISPGEILYRTSDEADRYWGTPIEWTTQGPGWVIVLDAAGGIVDFVVWGYPDADYLDNFDVMIDGHHFTRADLPWNGARVSAAGTNKNSLQRGGSSDHDNSSDWQFLDPPTQGDLNFDLQTPFATDFSTAIGFDAIGSGIGAAVEIDVQAEMFEQNASLWARVPFFVENPLVFDGLKLQMKYNDGFVAYINGVKVAEDNAPAVPVWNSQATGSRSVGQSLQFTEFDASAALPLLQPGFNVLAVHGLNYGAGSGDFLIVPELVGNGRLYFSGATAGAANGAGFLPSGPIVTQLTENPPPPEANEDLVITAMVMPTEGSIAAVTLQYRVMFGSNVTRAMRDDGNGGDVTAGDDVYTAVIPAAAYDAGEMIRWKVTATDTMGENSRFPYFNVPLDSPEYYGTVAVDPSIDSLLPVLHWFVQNPSAAGTTGGTRGAMFFEGEFYDNIRTDRHGQSTGGFNKKSYDVDFNKHYRFKYAEGQGRVKDINLLTNWADKAKVRNTLAYEVHRDAGLPAAGGAGSPYHVAFPIRVQQNGQFFSTADYVEDGDDRYLDRLGLDPTGALYKIYDTLSNTSGGEKKTRKHEGKSDLQALINGANLSNSTQRRQFYYDNLNVPEIVNFLAVFPIISNRDFGHKNYYVYRDTNGTGEWSFLPWDIDLTFGHNWTGSQHYFDDNMYWNNPLFVGSNNNLIADLFATSEIRQMYLRRVRTLMDDLLQPPGTPQAELKFEQRMDELVALMDPNPDPPGQGSDDADLDYQKWGSWTDSDSGAGWETMRQAVDRIKSDYLPQRRTYLYGLVGGGTSNIPAAQADFAALPQAQRKIVFGTVDHAPASNNQDEEYIEIVNNNSFAVDVSGWRLTEAVEFTFEPGTVIPSGGGKLYVAADLNAFRARADNVSGGKGLFVRGSYDGHLSAYSETIRLVDNRGGEIVTHTYTGSPSAEQEFLRITELMYHPADADVAAGELSVDDDLFEFIELVNTSTTATLALGGVRFTEGVDFNFTAAGAAIVAADFDAGADAFTYADNTFNGTSRGDLASGTYEAAGGYGGSGGLHVQLGPHTTGLASSGAWSRSFQLAEPESVGVSLQYRMLLGSGLEADEYGEVILEIDGVRYGNDLNNSLIHGNGNGTSPPDDDFGWRTANFSVSLGSGDHTITIGGYSNKANSSSLNEFVEVFIDNVVVSGSPELGPGQRVLVVRNRDAFESRYGTALNVAGEFRLSGLSNSGERIKLEDALNGTILDFAYNDSDAWPGRADGKGAALELVDVAAVPDRGPLREAYLEDGDHWQSSSAYGGTPGEASQPYQGVLINEVLSHTDFPLSDAIELYNATAEPIDVGGWYLSDSWGWDFSPDTGDYRKFRIPGDDPNRTTIPPGGYLVFNEDDFNPVPGNPGPKDFALNGAHGDDVWLMRADAAGNLTHFGDHVKFGAQANAESWGRWPDGTASSAAGGRALLYPMTAQTLPGANSGPRLASVVISEVHYHPYHPNDQQVEFVEIYNTSTQPVDLTHWRLAKGIGYEFADGLTLAGLSALIVVPFDPAVDLDRLAQFSSAYTLPDPLQIVGPYAGQLSNGGEQVQLQYPDAPPADEPDYYPGLLEDEVIYDDEGDWPVSADGGGDSLGRVAPNGWGNDATNWTAAMPTPGTVSITPHVAGRYVFYNHSSFDGENPAVGAEDDGAIATDKTALLGGGVARFQNYTSYTRGLNGLMIDLAGLPPGVTPAADDFQFRVGNDGTPGDGAAGGEGRWAPAPAADAFDVRISGGAGGTYRVTFTWPDGAIRNQWLQVTVLGDDLGLPSDDVFYFGNAMAEAGNSTADARISTTDLLLARNNPRDFTAPATIDFRYDFDRDGDVNAADVLLARNNQTNFLTALNLINLSAAESGEGDVAAAWAVWLDAPPESGNQDRASAPETLTAESVDRLFAVN